MSFLNPFMLFGLAAVAVPIIIHLLNRRKFQRVVWAAMRFLRVSVEQNQRRMRIEDLLLLMLRCLLLILLALALARPAIFSQASNVFGRSKVTGVIILDNSYSMGASDGTQTRFDRARAAAERVIDSMPAGSATAIFLASDVVDDVISLPTFDLNLARKTVREAGLTDRATDLFPALDAALKTLGDRLAIRKEIYLITDAQATGWRQMPEIQRVLEKSKGDIATCIIRVDDPPPKNLGISGLRLTSGLSPARQALRFEAKVTNYSDDEARDVKVTLNADEEPPGDEFNIPVLPAGSTKNVSLFAKFRTEGYHSVTARLAEDRLFADDHRTLAVRAIREVRVLLVDGDPGSEPRDAETYFVGHALVPVPKEAEADYHLRTKRIGVTELSEVQWDDFDAVVFANVSDVSETTAVALESYVRRGGGWVVFPGARVNPSFYNERFVKRTPLLPGTLGAAQGDEGQDAVFVTLQEKNYEHPIVELWNDPASGNLGSARFFRRFVLQAFGATNVVVAPASALASEASEARVILRYSDGLPAVMERDFGLGRVILFSSTADTAWNDLAVRPAFVPLLHRVIGAIVQRQDEGLNLPVGDKFTRRLRMEYLDKDATYVKPQAAEGVRELRRIELINGSPMLQYAQTDLAGLYHISVAEPALSVQFATQTNPYESDLKAISPAQLQTLENAAQVITWRSGLALRNLVQQQRSGMEFWLPLVVIALLAAAGETFLGQWFSRSK